MDEDDLPFVDVRLGEVEDVILRCFSEGHRPTGQGLQVVNQFLHGGVGIFGVQHVGGDVGFFSSKNLKSKTKRGG